MTKTAILQAHSRINKIEDLLGEAASQYLMLPPEIQNAINYYLNGHITFEHGLGRSLQAATKLREDWPAVVSKIKTD